MTRKQYSHQLHKLVLSELHRIGIKHPSQQDFNDMKTRFESMPFVKAAFKTTQG